MSIKQFNVKQAQRWLEKLKTENLQSYKDITKFLRKYQRTDDEYDCYLKISHTLLFHTELTKQLNLFLQDGNKFVVTRPDDEKLKDFMGYVKKNRPEVFNKIICMIQQLSKSKGEGNTQVSKMIIPKLKEIVMGDPELERLTEEALDMTDEELIRKKNIDHLKVSRVFIPLPEEPKDQQAESQMIKDKKIGGNEFKDFLNVDRKDKLGKPPPIGNFTNSIEERIALKQLERSIDDKTYKAIMKIVKIYTLNLITRKQASDLLAAAGMEEIFLENLKEIFQTRQLDRRKTSYFKPLGDINFSSYERTSPSYVTLPFFYPVKCSTKTPEIRALTNDKWISVPYGSEESQNFSVRNKNTNEINLLKAEDERYEYDLYLKRLTKAKELLDKFIDQTLEIGQSDRNKLLRKAIDLGIIQILYKNCKDEQREELEWFLRSYTTETCKLIRDKLQVEVNELRSIKDIHATKSWNETAIKNFYKALDLKGFEFKKNEKQKMKNTFFMAELAERNKILGNGSELKSNTLSFEQKKQFFTILNSFQCSSRTQKCTSRVLPPFQLFNLKDEERRHLFPVMIMAFEDEGICDALYSMLIFYIDTAQLSETQKFKCKIFLEQYLIGYMGWKYPTRKILTEVFNEEFLYQKISNPAVQFDCDQCFSYQTEAPRIKQVDADRKAQQQSKFKKMNVGIDVESRYSYFPKKQSSKNVIYCSEHVYCLTRYLYALYQRLIKMKEVSESEQVRKQFQLLFYASIKAKEGIKFEQNLNLLFGTHAYLFGTIYKIFQSLIKSIIMSSNCLLTNNSFRFAEQQQSQDLYFLLVNRFCLSNGLASNKIIRLAYQQPQKVLYVNYLDCYYKSEDAAKDMIKKRSEISKGVEMYTTDEYGSNGRKLRKLNEHYQANCLEYTFDNTTIRMQNHLRNEDLLILKNKKINFIKTAKRELKRVHKLYSVTH